MRALRIAMITQVGPPTPNGVNVSRETLTTGLEARGHEVWTIGPDHPHLPLLERYIAVPSVALPGAGGYRLALAGGRTLKTLLHKLDIDVVHHHHIFNLAWSCRNLAWPQVITYHTRIDHYTHYVPFPSIALKKAIARWWSAWMLNHAQGIIAPAGSTQKSLQDFGVTRPIWVIPTECEVASGPPDEATLAAYGIDPGRPTLLFVGRLAKEKNLDLLFDGFDQAIREGTDCQLVLVGDGPERMRLEREARVRHLPVCFTGNLDRPEALALYHTADLFVFTSLSETQGLVLGEAVLAGLPIVAVHSEAADELLADGEYGLLVRPTSEDVAHGIQTGLRQSRTAVRSIDGPGMAEQMEAVYHELVERFGQSNLWKEPTHR